MADSRGDSAHEFRIDGSRIETIDNLYAQLNALLMGDADWTLGASLDALNDVLYGFGPDDDGAGPAVVTWADHELSRHSLGLATTQRWLEAKLDRPDVFDARTIRAQLDALLSGDGKTYVDLVQDVFAAHPNVRLVLV